MRSRGREAHRLKASRGGWPGLAGGRGCCEGTNLQKPGSGRREGRETEKAVEQTAKWESTDSLPRFWVGPPRIWAGRRKRGSSATGKGPAKPITPHLPSGLPMGSL